MLGPTDYTLWCLSFLLEAGVVVCAFVRPDLRRYLSLTLYMLCAALVNVAQFVCLRNFGYQSHQYLYTYYYTESLLTISLFSVVIQFYQHVFEEMKVSKHIRAAAGVLVAVVGAGGFLSARASLPAATAAMPVPMKVRRETFELMGKSSED